MKKGLKRDTTDKFYTKNNIGYKLLGGGWIAKD